MDLVKVDNNDYETYETLLLKRDDYRKAARGAQVLYIKEFGDLINRSFQKQIDCIAKKKCISYYQAAANRGETVKIDELNAYLRDTMEEYNRQLADMLADYESCKDVGFVSGETAAEVKGLYRKIAKLIHPDMHPDLAGQGIFNELWTEVVIAYQNNDLTELEELEVLVYKAMEDNGEEVPEIVIPDIRERIDAVWAEIEEIMSTNPYQYKILLEDPEAVNKKKQELQREIEEYEEYGKQLDAVLEEYLKEGVIITWPMN